MYRLIIVHFTDNWEDVNEDWAECETEQEAKSLAKLVTETNWRKERYSYRKVSEAEIEHEKHQWALFNTANA